MSIKRFFSLISLIIIISTSIYSQTIFMGVRDNQFVQLGYIDKQNWFVIAENSVFVTKMKNQSFNGYLGYKNAIFNINYMGCIYGGLHYNKLYNSYGGIVELDYDTFSWLRIKGGIRPHYDSDYGYRTAFLGALSFRVHEDISLQVEYSNYPEYRLCESRLKAGALFEVKRLSIKPEISVPTEGNMENIRLLMSFGYKLYL